MKKLFCILVAVVLANCEIKPRSANAGSGINRVACNTHSQNCVGMDTFEQDGMIYMVLSMDSQYTSPAVVNLTKDKLEVELLKKQLFKLN